MASKSVIERLLEDHQEVRQMFARFETAERAKWWDIFSELTNGLVRHEVVEEEIVYPEVRKELPKGDALADARIHEQSEAEELLATMEKKGPEDTNFPANLTKLRAAVLAHAEAEEKTVFVPLSSAVSQERLERLGDRYEKAKSLAPTHPHPNAPDTPPGNMVLGPVAAMADRFRDAMRKAS
ncbi:MAG: hemerythrin domain-containing protein [Acidimicrobiales bacterium]